MAGIVFGDTRRGRRAQLLLAGAFILAVALIGLTIVFTSSSYTTALVNQENEVVRGADAVSVREAVRADLTRHFEHVYETNPRGSRRAPFEAVVAPVGNETTGHYSRQGRLVNVTMDASGAGFIEGTHIKQGQSAELSNPGGVGPSTNDWIVAENAELRNATFQISDIRARNPQNAINISFDTPASAGGNWSMTFHRSNTSPIELVIRTRSPEGVERTCTRPDPNVAGQDLYVDLDGGTAAGTPCAALAPIDPGRHTYDINITRGQRASGKYWMIVSKPPSDADVTTFSVGSIDAQTDDVLYGARVRYRYHSGTVSYETNIDIAHREIA